MRGWSSYLSCLKTLHHLLGKFNEWNILVVAHNGVNRFYLSYKLGMIVKDYQKIVQENSSVTLFTLDEQESLHRGFWIVAYRSALKVSAIF
jgi:broad specificity phosphatase PhoE